MGLREQKVETTRRAIISAAYELFGVQGFEGTTVEEIAERAVVAPRTIYRHFDSKESIVFGEFNGEIDRIAELVRDQCRTGVSISRIFDAFADHFEHRQHHPRFPVLTALMQENAELTRRANQWRGELAQRVAREIAACGGRGEPSLTDRARAAALVAASAMAVAEWARHGHEDDLVELPTPGGASPDLRPKGTKVGAAPHNRREADALR